jgi:hypothetical protein
MNNYLKYGANFYAPYFYVFFPKIIMSQSYCSLVLITTIGGFGIYEGIVKDEINATTIFYLFLGIGFLFHSLTWGEVEGKHEGKKDELKNILPY